MRTRSPYLVSGLGHALFLSALLAVTALERPPLVVPGVRIVSLPGGPRSVGRTVPPQPVKEEAKPPPEPPVKPVSKPVDTAPPTRQAAQPVEKNGALPTHRQEIVSKTQSKPKPQAQPPARSTSNVPMGPVAVVSGPGAGGVGLEAEGDPGPLAGYLELLRDKVAANWEPPPAFGRTGQVRAVVFFSIPRQGGEPQQVEVQVESGSSIFDRAALRAVLSAAPLQPLPSAWTGQSIGIKFTFYQEY